MVDAESQHYNPRYGLSTDDGPVALAQNVPQDQLQNALAVGIIPGADTDDQHYGQWPYTPNEKQCAAIQAAGGNSFSSREGALVIIALCDTVFELQGGSGARRPAAQRATLGQQRHAARVQHLQRRHVPALHRTGTLGRRRGVSLTARRAELRGQPGLLRLRQLAHL